MHTEPSVMERPAQRYVGITSAVTMENIGVILAPLHGRLFGWLDERGIAPDGAPFWKYNVIDMSSAMEVEVAIPVVDEVSGDETVQFGVLPAGRYVTMSHLGHPDQLM